MNICILKESRKNEFRVPLVPKDIKELIKKNSKLKFFIEPSNQRVIKDRQYFSVGCKKYNSQKIDLFLSIKEINLSSIKKNQNYMMFSHTIKGQKHNMPLLKKILKNNCSLIDYELLRNTHGLRSIGFGWHAGIMGAYLTLSKFLKIKKNKNVIFTIKEIIRSFKNKDFGNTRILITGNGLVSKGAQFFLNRIGIKRNKKINQSYFNVLEPKDYYQRIDRKFSDRDLILRKGSYRSNFKQYIGKYDILISCHYWDEKFPKLFTSKDIDNGFFKIIGDITCDINGSIPTTIKTTSLKSPYYKYKGVDVMAVDNLPSALPLEASTYFSNKLKKQLPKILNSINNDSVESYFISKKGFLNYRYLNLIDYLI